MSHNSVYLVVWKDEADYRYNYNAFYDKDDGIKYMIKDYRETYGLEQIPEGKLSEEEMIDSVNKTSIFPPSLEECGFGYYFIEKISIK